MSLMVNQLLLEPFQVLILSDLEKKESEISQLDLDMPTPKFTNVPIALNQNATSRSTVKKKIRPSVPMKDAPRLFGFRGMYHFVIALVTKSSCQLCLQELLSWMQPYSL